MIYLITGPILWTTKGVVWTVKRPTAIVRSRRNRRPRKDVKELKRRPAS